MHLTYLDAHGANFIKTIINIENKGENFPGLLKTVLSQQVKYHTVKCTQNLSPLPLEHVPWIYEYHCRRGTF